MARDTNSDEITMYCGECGAKIEVSASSAGKATHCPDCKAKVPIPSSYLARPQIRFYCPRCEGRVRAWAEQAGESMRCPGCDLSIELPQVEGYMDFDEGLEQSDLDVGGGALIESGSVAEAAYVEEERDEPDEEWEEEPEPEPKEAETDRPAARKPTRSSRRARRMIRAALWALVVIIPIGVVIFLRTTRPEWLDHKLMKAAEAGTYTQASLLVTCGADVNTKDASGRTALHAAAEKGNKGIVDMLIAKGAKVDEEDRSGRTPLLLAVLGGHTDIVETLLKKGADIHVTHPKDGRRLLDIAMVNGHNHIADLLLQKREETRPQAPPSANIILIPEGAAQRSALRIPRSRLRPTPTPTRKATTAAPSSTMKKPTKKKHPVIVLDPKRLMPVGYYVRYMLKIGVRRMWGAKSDNDVKKKFLIIVFSGPLDLFKISDYEFRYFKRENSRLTTRDLTQHYDPTRFSLIFADGQRVRASAIAPNWVPVETTPAANIFHLDLCKSYKSESKIRKGEVAVAWLLNAADCKSPFKIRVGRGKPVAVPEVRYDAEEE